jgi:hypothetical protein
MDCGEKYLEEGFNPSAVYDGAVIIRDRINAIYTMLGPKVTALPARQIIATGEQPADCEQFVVAFGEMERGLIGDGEYSSECNPPIIVTYKIQVIRCIPTPDSRGNPPVPETVSAAARVAAIDANILMESVCSLSLWPGFMASGEVEVGEPLGGMQGVTLTLRTLLGV